MNPESPKLDEAAARRLMAVLGRAEGEFVASLTAPIYWVIRDADRSVRTRNGSAFFLDAGEGPFGVTANHVFEGWRHDAQTLNVEALQIGNRPLALDGENAIIAAHQGLDIATFRVSADMIASIGKTVLTGYQNAWPPRPPQRDRGIYYAGFPGVATIWRSRRDISFGVATGGGIASSVSETDVSSMLEREHMIASLGDGVPPEQYDFRGMSGGPMLSVIEYRGLRTWALAGVIYEGPNPADDDREAIPGLEIIKARRAHFIRPDASLDAHRWDTLQP